MRWHVVCAFIIVFIVGVVLFNGLIEIHFKICPYCRVRVFIDGQEAEVCWMNTWQIPV